MARDDAQREQAEPRKRIQLTTYDLLVAGGACATGTLLIVVLTWLVSLLAP